jgi:hypothetical protein
MNYLNFDSRTTYLAMRKVWSADYFTAVKAIRQAKIGIKEAMRAGEFTWKAYAALRKAHGAIEELRDERIRMKEEAQRQYVATKLIS